MSYNFEEKRNIIMNHYLKPNNRKEVNEKKIVSFSNSCGDELVADYSIEDGVLKDIHFMGSGCAYFVSSSDMLCDYLKGRKVSECIFLIDEFEKIIHSKESTNEMEKMGELNVFLNVQKHSNRLDCVQMLSKPLKEKLQNEG
ncbi:iron-sulfur cluster assembly scaffold protein [Mycoplasma tauri]|uniref:iron-sulfur cluster assembly scaffold protein n=2 Tax=Mycoplasma tauri TaxID=547987 RepID=UPI001CBBB8AA|nr:iron-sulfur cluster assembly scaffold protein [Mycoplasma tauri]